MNKIFTPDSPELTAYALGELPATERAALEAQLAADPSLQAEVAALKATAAQLCSEMAAEPQPELAVVQREWIAAQAEQRTAKTQSAASPQARPANRWWWILCGGGGAIAILTAGLLLPSLKKKSPFSGQLASVSETAPQIPSTRAVVTPTENESLVSLADEPALVVTANQDAVGRPEAAETASISGGVQPQNSPQPEKGKSERARDLSPDSITTEPSVVARSPIDTASASAPLPAPAAPPANRVDFFAPQSGLAAQASSGANGPATRSSQRTELGRGTAGKSLALTTPDSSRGYRPAPAAESRDTKGLGTLLRKRYELSPTPESSAERYAHIVENEFRSVDQTTISTFGMDVDTASYANVRRFLREGKLPPADAVRLEELINYFPYSLPSAKGSDPFGVVVETAECPWNSAHRLIRIALRARDVSHGERPPANIVFLVDVSGSMEPENKLPLVKKSLRLLVEQLTPRDTVAIVTYAGEAGIAMEPTRGSDKEIIYTTIDRLSAGGSTHGSAGIVTAYELARKAFVKEGVNRVLLCTDGDFNVGTTSQEGLLELITQQAKSGVFLSVLGYGMDNYQDATTELLADKGNGNYAYIDSFAEARKVLREQLHSTLVTVAKDAKIQVEFNPARVASWRLLGYENRSLADQDFKDDHKDAGDVGAGQSVTVLYEVQPAGTTLASAENLRYQPRSAPKGAAQPVPTKKTAAGDFRDELLYLKIRHKLPEASKSTEWTVAVKDDERSWIRASDDFQFSAAVAGFGMLLRNSPHDGAVSYDLVQRLAQEGLGPDKEGYRAEFVDLVRRAQRLAEARPGSRRAPGLRYSPDSEAK